MTREDNNAEGAKNLVCGGQGLSMEFKSQDKRWESGQLSTK